MTFDPATGGSQPPESQPFATAAPAPNAHPDLNPYGDGKCPECGADLQSVDPKKHAVAHYGEGPIPFTPQTAASTHLARQRQAMLRGEQLPER